jgi:hypothetical protein
MCVFLSLQNTPHILTEAKDMQRVWQPCIQRDRSRGLLFHGSPDRDVPEEREDRHAQPRRRRLKAWFILRLTGPGICGSDMEFVLGRLGCPTTVWQRRARRVSAPAFVFAPPFWTLLLMISYARAPQGRPRHRARVAFGLRCVRQADPCTRERCQQAVLRHCCTSVSIPGREHRRGAERSTVRRRLRPILCASSSFSSIHPILTPHTDNNDCGLDQPNVSFHFRLFLGITC